MNPSKGYSKYFVILFSILVCVTTVFPVYWMINISMKKEVDLFMDPPRILPFNVNFDGYMQALKLGTILTWIKNSFSVSLLCVAVSLIAASMAAFALSRFRYKTNNIYIFSILCTQMIAPALIVAPTYLLLNSIKLINTHAGLILVDSGMVLAFSVWVLKGFFDNIPKEIDEAAHIDGCSYLMVFLRIIFPLSVPTIVSVVLINFFDVYNEYMFATTLITSKNLWLGTSGIAANTTRIGTNWSITLSQTSLFCIPPIIFYFVFQRYIVKGMTAGAVKF
jgi:ABC-type sugar transport system, permease component